MSFFIKNIFIQCIHLLVGTTAIVEGSFRDLGWVLFCISPFNSCPGVGGGVRRVIFISFSCVEVEESSGGSGGDRKASSTRVCFRLTTYCVATAWQLRVGGCFRYILFSGTLKAVKTEKQLVNLDIVTLHGTQHPDFTARILGKHKVGFNTEFTSLKN